MPQNLQVNEETVQYLTSLVEKGEYDSIGKAAEEIIKKADHQSKDQKLAQLLEEADASGIDEGFSISEYLKQREKAHIQND